MSLAARLALTRSEGPSSRPEGLSTEFGLQPQGWSLPIRGAYNELALFSIDLNFGFITIFKLPCNTSYNAHDTAIKMQKFC